MDGNKRDKPLVNAKKIRPIMNFVRYGFTNEKMKKASFIFSLENFAFGKSSSILAAELNRDINQVANLLLSWPKIMMSDYLIL